ncbi:MAG: cysteine peptidase family C39 domain-containing protein [Actinomycetota bacterium]|nr:cysteine peptidase family C39 domain-containing protein [Actinomycetota bacterium]
MSETKTFTVPADEPSVVLLRLVRKMRLPYSGRLVSAAVAAHPQPQSLLALVQVAPRLGLRITAARVEPEGLDDLQLPAIAHFAGEPGGFGVIERVAPDAVEVWDGRNGRRSVPRGEFLRYWSGIVALAERDPSQQKTERGYRRQRLLEAFAGPPATRPDLATPRLRNALAALAALLVVTALWRHPAGTRLGAIAVTVLSAAGFALSAVLSNATSDQKANVDVPGCPRGKLMNCESVLNSQYSRIRGVSMSDAGTGFFGAILLSVATAAAVPGFAPGKVVALAYLAAVPAALALVALQVVMRRFCTLCLAVHAVVILAAVAGLPFVDDPWPGATVLAGGGLLVLYGAAVTFLGIPFLTRHARTQQLIERQQRLATSPFSTLAYVLTEPLSPVRGEDVGFRLPGPEAAHEAVLFAHPTCRQCAQTIDELTALAEAGTVSAYVTILPRLSSGPERAACEAVVAAGVAFGPAALLHAYGVAKKSFAALMNDDPVAVLADEMSVRRDALEARLPEARAAIERTESLAEGRIEGTPAVFFDGRLYPYNIPVSHLTSLLARYPELLPPPGSGREPRGPREAAPA